MNPEALIALLKELFGAAPSSAEALKNIGEMGAEAGPGLQRLFRGEQAGTQMGRGQLFTKDIKDAASFAKKTGDSPTLHALDVPEAVASRGNIAESKGFDTVGRRSIIDSRGASPKRAEDSSFIVSQLAKDKKKIFPAVAGATGLGTMSAHQSNAQGLVDENGQEMVDEDGKPINESMSIPPAGEPNGSVPSEQKQVPFKDGMRPDTGTNVKGNINSTIEGLQKLFHAANIPFSKADKIINMIVPPDMQSQMATPFERTDTPWSMLLGLPKAKAAAPVTKLLSAGENIPNAKRVFQMGGETAPVGVTGETAKMRFPDTAMGTANEMGPEIHVQPNDKPAYLGESSGVNKTGRVEGGKIIEPPVAEPVRSVSVNAKPIQQMPKYDDSMPDLEPLAPQVKARIKEMLADPRTMAAGKVLAKYALKGVGLGAGYEIFKHLP